MLATFVQTAAPGMYLSTVVAAELRASTTRPRDLRDLEDAVLKPYYKRGRIVNPSAASWAAQRIRQVFSFEFAPAVPDLS